jgi:Photosynthesis system II assembly factor YCF48
LAVLTGEQVMALDDRERNFEKALKRELRANGAGGLDCPDAETLAAYHERMLSPEEMAAQKSHFAACPRCQEILATLEVTEAIPGGVEDSEKVLEKAAPVLARIGDLAASAKSASVREMPQRRTYLRWAVPAGAIAAGLLVWIAINTSRPAKTAIQNAPVQVAENREEKEQRLSATKPMAEAQAPSSTMADKVTKNGRTYTRQELDALASGGQAKPLERKQSGVASNYAHGPRMTQNQMQNQIQNNGKIVAQGKSVDQFDYSAGALPNPGRNEAAVAQNAPRPSKQARAEAAAAPGPPAPSVAAKEDDARARKDLDTQAATQMVVVTGEAASVADEKEEEENAKAALKKLKAAPGVGGFAGTSLRDSGQGGLLEIVTPDPKVFWFGLANGGLVMKTEDGGKTSKRQGIGEGIKVLAGSAVDTKTCWLIAEKGIVLRTVDGGKHWTKMIAPEVAEFTSITATDALRATITDAGGKVRYSTSDGGATWVAALP